MDFLEFGSFGFLKIWKLDFPDKSMGIFIQEKERTKDGKRLGEKEIFGQL